MGRNLSALRTSVMSFRRPPPGTRRGGPGGPPRAQASCVSGELPGSVGLTAAVAFFGARARRDARSRVLRDQEVATRLRVSGDHVAGGGLRPDLHLARAGAQVEPAVCPGTTHVGVVVREA